MGELLRIGDFSARCGLSPKMLRSYAAAGLLLPAAVDGSSGYRYCSACQLPLAGAVALLRRAGIAVDDIVAFLANPDLRQLDRWDRGIVSASEVRRQALASASARPDRLFRGPPGQDARRAGRQEDHGRHGGRPAGEPHVPDPHPLLR